MHIESTHSRADRVMPMSSFDMTVRAAMTKIVCMTVRLARHEQVFPFTVTFVGTWMTRPMKSVRNAEKYTSDVTHLQ